MAREPKPKREGYSAAYRRKLEQQFVGPVERERLGRASPWVRTVISDMLKAIENRDAEIAALRAQLPKPKPFDDWGRIG